MAVAAPPVQPYSIALLAACFRAWADDAAETRSIVLAVRTSSAWSPIRCLVVPLYDRNASFANHLVELRGMLLSSVGARAFRDTRGLVAISLTHVDK
eukprot:7470397-Pyramimonas_sp.AAC.1